MGECWRGAGAGASSMFMLAVGTGIGAAFCRGGQVMRGTHHMAGEVGSLRLDLADGLVEGPGPHLFEQLSTTTKPGTSRWNSTMPTTTSPARPTLTGGSCLLRASSIGSLGAPFDSAKSATSA
ncbi:ROK family protein [Propioniciclava sinopodophylli]|uniref:ROK family protein n=1 Tax=Propioniciclava sinopodophylli TaxID=1837344 RepID=UPI003CD0DBA2